MGHTLNRSAAGTGTLLEQLTNKQIIFKMRSSLSDMQGWLPISIEWLLSLAGSQPSH